jgi:hypothetical protein
MRSQLLVLLTDFYVSAGGRLSPKQDIGRPVSQVGCEIVCGVAASIEHISGRIRDLRGASLYGSVSHDVRRRQPEMVVRAEEVLAETINAILAGQSSRAAFRSLSDVTCSIIITLTQE